MLKRIWQWFKNVISKVLTFFGFKASTKSNTNKLNSNTTRKQENEVGLEKIIDGISLEDIEKIRNFFSGAKGWYADDGVLSSLVDLCINSWFDETKPVILVQNTTSKLLLHEEFTRVSQLCDKRNILYIRLSPTRTPGEDKRHWVVFYFSKSSEQNKLLFIDPLYLNQNLKDVKKTLKLFLKKQNYSLHASITQIQRDGYSCGLIASEVTRMIYSNHAKFHAKFKEINSKSVNLGDFLPYAELDQLIVSCDTESNINCGENSNAIDIRVAHNFVVYKTSSISDHFDLNIISSLEQNPLFKILTNEEVDFNEFRKQVKEIRELGEKYDFKEESEMLMKNIGYIRANLVGSENKANVVWVSQNIKILSQAHIENMKVLTV